VNYCRLKGQILALALVGVDLVIVVDPVIVRMLGIGGQAHLEIDNP